MEPALVFAHSEFENIEDDELVYEINMCVWIHLSSPSQMPFPPPYAEGFKSAMDCGIGKCKLLVFLDSQIIYRAQDLQSGRIFFFFTESGKS